MKKLRHIVLCLVNYVYRHKIIDLGHMRSHTCMYWVIHNARQLQYIHIRGNKNYVISMNIFGKCHAYILNRYVV